jgi:formylglycine-generating enzyme required for sulfatase activity
VSPTRLSAPIAAFAAVAVLAGLAAPAAASGSAKRAAITTTAVKVGAPGNPSVGIVPFTDAVYQSCADAPQTSPACQMVGGVNYRYRIGELEVTVRQWVRFLNTVDPQGNGGHGLYDPTEASAGWPKYGSINRSANASAGHHYSVAYPSWNDKPYGFADFIQAARFANSLSNGRLLSKEATSANGFRYVTYRVRLARQSRRGMYDLSDPGTGRTARSGFVVPSQNEWIKAAYFDPSGGGTFSYWKYPTNPGVFGDGSATAPSVTTLNPGNGDVTNAATQPLATYHPSSAAAPTWCPAAVEPRSDCSEANPFGIDPTTYAKLYQGNVSTVGGAQTTSPWGTLDQGGNAVEWTDTVTPPPFGTTGKRVWRRLHGGIANAPAYQLWLSAIGLQPQRNPFYQTTYPWLGFRIGTIGKLKAAR